MKFLLKLIERANLKWISFFRAPLTIVVTEMNEIGRGMLESNLIVIIIHAGQEQEYELS